MPCQLGGEYGRLWGENVAESASRIVFACGHDCTGGGMGGRARAYVYDSYHAEPERCLRNLGIP